MKRNGTAAFMANDVALDSSAVIALIRNEPGHEVVRDSLENAAISTVNICEISDSILRRGGSPEGVMTVLRELQVTVHDTDLDLALEASALLPATRSAGLSLGDRFCLALAKRLDRPVLTADRAWTTVAEAIGVRVQLIR